MREVRERKTANKDGKREKKKKKRRKASGAMRKTRRTFPFLSLSHPVNPIRDRQNRVKGGKRFLAKSRRDMTRHATPHHATRRSASGSERLREGSVRAKSGSVKTIKKSNRVWVHQHTKTRVSGESKCHC